MSSNQRKLTREVDATVIPAGDAVKLPEGTSVDITHRLGGNFTVVCEYGMFRIAGKDADAIGEQAPDSAAGTGDAPEASAGESTADGVLKPRPTEDVLWEALRTVYDPEIPVNIVDLGLVYSLDIQPQGEEVIEGQGADERHVAAGWHADVKMTLTAPGCGMGPVIAEDAKLRCEAVQGITSAQVDIVWEPPWAQTMISEEGKMELGLI